MKEKCPKGYTLDNCPRLKNINLTTGFTVAPICLRCLTADGEEAVKLWVSAIVENRSIIPNLTEKP